MNYIKGPAYSPQEQNLLFSLIGEWIETDFEFPREKHEAWENITEKFNEISGTHRCVKSIKCWWDNQKKKYRRAARGAKRYDKHFMSKMRDILHISDDSEIGQVKSIQTLTAGKAFTFEEKELLLQLISKNITVLEDKSVDKVTYAKKEQVWETLAVQYNAQMDPRNIDSLKIWWRKLRTKARKLIESDRAEGKIDGNTSYKELLLSKAKHIIGLSDSSSKELLLESDDIEDFRPRTHFTLEEKELLLQLILENIGVVENKAVDLRDKDQVWENIGILFNAQMEPCTVDMIKEWWLKMKVNARKLTELHMYKKQTDGREIFIEPFMQKVLSVLRFAGLLRQETISKDGVDTMVECLADDFELSSSDEEQSETACENQSLDADLLENNDEMQVNTENVDPEVNDQPDLLQALCQKISETSQDFNQAVDSTTNDVSNVCIERQSETTSKKRPFDDAVEVQSNAENSKLDLNPQPNNSHHLNHNILTKTMQNSPKRDSSAINPPKRSVKKMKASSLEENPVFKLVEVKPKTETSMRKFFDTLLPDAESLTANRQRQLKAKMLSSLNDLLDEQENESTVSSGPSSSYNPENRLRFCCVSTCIWNQVPSKYISYFPFPKDEHLRAMWKRKTKYDGEVREDTFVCSKHFLLSDLACAQPSTDDPELKKNTYLMLRAKAFPCRYLPLHCNKPPKLSERRKIQLEIGQSYVQRDAVSENVYNPLGSNNTDIVINISNVFSQQQTENVVPQDNSERFCGETDKQCSKEIAQNSPPAQPQADFNNFNDSIADECSTKKDSSSGALSENINPETELAKEPLEEWKFEDEIDSFKDFTERISENTKIGRLLEEHNILVYKCDICVSFLFVNFRPFPILIKSLKVSDDLIMIFTFKNSLFFNENFCHVTKSSNKLESWNQLEIILNNINLYSDKTLEQWQTILSCSPTDYLVKTYKAKGSKVLKQILNTDEQSTKSPDIEIKEEPLDLIFNGDKITSLDEVTEQFVKHPYVIDQLSKKYGMLILKHGGCILFLYINCCPFPILNKCLKVQEDLLMSFSFKSTLMYEEYFCKIIKSCNSLTRWSQLESILCKIDSFDNELLEQWAAIMSCGEPGSDDDSNEHDSDEPESNEPDAHKPVSDK